MWGRKSLYKTGINLWGPVWGGGASARSFPVSKTNEPLPFVISFWAPQSYTNTHRGSETVGRRKNSHGLCFRFSWGIFNSCVVSPIVRPVPLRSRRFINNWLLQTFNKTRFSILYNLYFYSHFSLLRPSLLIASLFSNFILNNLSLLCFSEV